MGACLVFNLSFGTDDPPGGNALIDLPVCSTTAPFAHTPNCQTSKGLLTTTLTVSTTALQPIFLPSLGKSITLANADVYNGTLASDVWEVSASDQLRIRLVNQLAYESSGDGPSERHLTNLHTHGLIVKPYVVLADPKADPRTSRVIDYIGDNVLACSAPAGHTDDCTTGNYANFLRSKEVTSLQYRIHIPAIHAEGLYWYHPHWHHAAAAQVGRGLSGLIWVNNPTEIPEYRTIARSRYLSIKDLLVENVHDDTAPGSLSGGLVANPADVTVSDTFGDCLKADQTANLGLCASTDRQHLWLFTVNGQVLPDLSFDKGAAEVWKIANTSANTTYLLSLVPADNDYPIPMQIVGADGVALNQSCTNLKDDPRCESVLLMPASRIVLYVTRPPSTGANALDAVLISRGVKTGWTPPADGDIWPAVSLLRVHFPAIAPTLVPKPYLAVTANLASHVRSSIDIETWSKEEIAGRLASAGAAATTMQSHHPGASRHQPPTNLLGDCPEDSPQRLETGQSRLIVLDIANSNQFMVGAGVVMDTQITSGQAIEPALLAGIKTEEFSGSPSVCTHAGSDETWIIANKYSSNYDKQNHSQTGNAEMHNFHIHQTKYEVIDVYQPKRKDGTIPGFEVTKPTWKKGILHDTFPVPINGWIKIQLHFGRTQIGDFVYHCHILEHEDNGMMAHMRVLPKGQ